MKKLILLMPLMALSAITNCGAKNTLCKREIAYDEKGKDIIGIIEYSYNEKSLPIKLIATSPLTQSKIVTEQTYDDHDYVTYYKETTYNGDALISTKEAKMEITYDEKNRVTKIATSIREEGSQWFENGTIVYGYPSEHIVDETYYELSGQISAHFIYTYNDQGLLINKKRDDSIEENIDYLRDEHGCALTINEYGANGELDASTTSTFLDHLYDHPLKEVTTIYDEDGETPIDYKTSESEYNNDKCITLYKGYLGKEDTGTYEFFIRYEY